MDATNLHPTDWREWRRLRALQLKEKGWYHRLIAEALGVSEATVSRWFARAGAEGPEVLVGHPATGHPAKLSAEQKRLIPDLLWHGAEAYGFRGEVWTCVRVAKVIAEELGVTYHKDHVSRLLQELHWTPQVPITRAIQRDEEAVERWRVEVWTEMQQRARRERRTLVFIDEAGFYLLPGKVRTYAPEGLRPELYEWQTRDHLSVMGGATQLGKVYTLVRQEPPNGLASIAILSHLPRGAGEGGPVSLGGAALSPRVEGKKL